jgi:hypothetical protein
MIVFSSFNNVELFHSMLVDYCMLKSQEWGPMAAIGQRRPPLLINIDFTCCRNCLLLLFFLLFRRHRHHASFPHDVPSRTTQHNNRFGKEAAQPTAPMPEGMLIVTLSGKPWYVTLHIPTYIRNPVFGNRNHNYYSTVMNYWSVTINVIR